MMVTRVEIDGFKSFVDFSLDLEPLTVLAGPNNSGKSNLLEARVLMRDLIVRSTALFLDQVSGRSEEPDGVRRGRNRTRARGVAASGGRGTYVTPTELDTYLATASGR